MIVIAERAARTTLRNLITDVAGVRVGHADDAKLASGVTAIVFDEPAVASVDVRGGAPGTRETELLDPDETVERVDAIVLSGGSAFGLDAPGGVQAWLREQGRGFAIGPARRADRAGRDPVRPAQRRRQGLGPLSALSRSRLCGGRQRRRATSRSAAPAPGYGATTVNLKGGLGSASAQTRDGATVGAIVAVNAVGSVTVGDGPHFWAAPFEQDGEFGGRGLPAPLPPDALAIRIKGGARAEHHASRWSRPTRRSPRRRPSASR